MPQKRKYRVDFSRTFHGYYEVEASSSRKAEELAEELFESEDEPSYTVRDGTTQICLATKIEE